MVDAPERILLFGTYFGVSQSLPFFSERSVCAVVAPSIRPEEVEKIRSLCEKKKINVIEQPPKKSELFETFCREIKKLAPGLIWCNSYSMHIPGEILNIVNYNAVNIHWSLLPRNQGPNPIQWSIIKGDSRTGVTFHLMDSSIDTGDIIFQESVSIDEEDTWVSLGDKLAVLSSEMHKKYLPSILSHNFKRITQDTATRSRNKRLNADYPQIDFSHMDDMQIYNLIRAQVAPLKGAYIENTDGKRIYFNKLLSLREIAELRKRA